METSPQKSLGRIISQRAMQMSNSFPCKIWALGFICGVCITYLFLVASTPLRTAQLGFMYASTSGAIPQNSSFIHLGKGFGYIIAILLVGYWLLFLMHVFMLLVSSKIPISV